MVDGGLKKLAPQLPWAQGFQFSYLSLNGGTWFSTPGMGLLTTLPFKCHRMTMSSFQPLCNHHTQQLPIQGSQVSHRPPCMFSGPRVAQPKAGSLSGWSPQPQPSGTWGVTKLTPSPMLTYQVLQLDPWIDCMNCGLALWDCQSLFTTVTWIILTELLQPVLHAAFFSFPWTFQPPITSFVVSHTLSVSISLREEITMLF